MTTVQLIKAAKQEKLFKLSDSERAAKYVQVLGCLDELEALKAEKKEFLSGIKDQIADAETRLAVLREDLGVPASSLGPQMLAARDEERSR